MKAVHRLVEFSIMADIFVIACFMLDFVEISVIPGY